MESVKNKKARHSLDRRVDDIVVAKREARTVGHYIRHLSRGGNDNFWEVNEESKDGHCESLLAVAMEIVFARGNQKLIEDIGHYSPFKAKGYTPSNWDTDNNKFYHIRD